MSVNAAYYTALAQRAAAAASCSELKLIYTPGVGLINDTITAVNAELSAIQTTAARLQGDINALADHLATLAGCESAATALTTLPGLASGMITLANVIAYCTASASIIGGFGTATNTSWIKEALSIARQIATIQADYSSLQSQITTLQDEVTALPGVLAAFESSCQTASLQFNSCTL